MNMSWFHFGGWGQQATCVNYKFKSQTNVYRAVRFK